MSLPDGVTTCLLTYGPITDTFGNPADSITVEVVADRTIVHAASGRTMFKNPVKQTATGSGSVQIPVPHTNQSGFRDQQQNALTGWYYTVNLSARFPGGLVQTDTKTFQPVTGQTEVDADLLQSPGMVTPGSVAQTTYVADPGGGTDGQVLKKQGNGYVLGDGGGGGLSTSRTAVKNSNYTASAGDLVPVDASAGSVTVTLPNAPADKALVAVKVIQLASPNTVSVATAGTDTFNRVGGVTSVAFSLIAQGANFQYDAATKVWTIAEYAVPLATTDARYPVVAPTPSPVDSQLLTYDGSTGTYKARNAATGPKVTGGLPPGFTRAQVPVQASDGAQQQVQSRIRHTALVVANTVRLVYVNYNIDGGINGLSPLTVKAGLEDAYGGVVPVTFNGSRTVTIDPGGQVISDPVSIDCPGPDGAFPFYWSRTLATVASAGGRWGSKTWGSGNVAQSGDSYEYGSSLTDKTLASGTLTTAGLISNMYGPTLILADSPGRRACVFGRGDSIMAGDTDNGSGSIGGVTGYFARAMAAARIPTITVGRSGEQAKNSFTYVGSQAQALTTGNGGYPAYVNNFMAGCTHVYAEHGVNDINTGLGNKNLAQWQALALDYWRQCGNRNAKVIAPTLTPSTSSTDGWATTANQSINAAGNNSVRTAYNDWLRAGAPIDPTTKAAVAIGTTGALLTGSFGHPLFAYDEIADLAETARNSGIWRANYTGDGVHPNATGSAALAAGVNVTRLAG